MPTKSKEIYHGKRINLFLVEADHPTKGTVIREVVDHPSAVVILPMLDEETLILIRNRREVVNETLWELPAGTLEKGEKPKECAFREVEEETGYRAKEMTPLLDFYTTPGFCNEKLYVFEASGLTHVGQKLDETELIEPVVMKVDEALKMIYDHKIIDAKTITTLLYTFSRFAKNRELQKEGR